MIGDPIKPIGTPRPTRWRLKNMAASYGGDGRLFFGGTPVLNVHPDHLKKDDPWWPAQVAPLTKIGPLDV